MVTPTPETDNCQPSSPEPHPPQALCEVPPPHNARASSGPAGHKAAPFHSPTLIGFLSIEQIFKTSELRLHN